MFARNKTDSTENEEFEAIKTIKRDTDSFNWDPVKSICIGPDSANWWISI